MGTQKKTAVKLAGVCFGIWGFVVGGVTWLNMGVVVEPDYIGGLLTASSILFGFFVSLFTIRGKKKEEDAFLKLSSVLTGSLTVAAFSMFLAGMRMIPSAFAFAMAFCNFALNCITLVVFFILRSFT